MNKTELIEKVSEKSGFRKADCAAIIGATLDAIVEAVKKKDSVVLIGFGTFTSAKRSARTGRNPQTGEKMKIKAATVPKFKPGKKFKDAVK